MAKEKMQKSVKVTGDRLEQISQRYDTRTGILTIYDGGKKIWSGRANIGDCYSVVYDGKEYRVSRQQFPHRKNHLLMWMFGFSKGNRFNTDEEFTKFLERHREKHKTPGYKEYIYSGPGYAFAIYEEEDNTPHRIAAWVTPNIDRKLAKKILSIKELNIAAMEDFYDGADRNLLTQYFGFRASDFEEVNRNLLMDTKEG